MAGGLVKSLEMAVTREKTSSTKLQWKTNMLDFQNWLVKDSQIVNIFVSFESILKIEVRTSEAIFWGRALYMKPYSCGAGWKSCVGNGLSIVQCEIVALNLISILNTKRMSLEMFDSTHKILWPSCFGKRCLWKLSYFIKTKRWKRCPSFVGVFVILGASHVVGIRVCMSWGRKGWWVTMYWGKFLVINKGRFGVGWLTAKSQELHHLQRRHQCLWRSWPMATSSLAFEDCRGRRVAASMTLLLQRRFFFLKGCCSIHKCGTSIKEICKNYFYFEWSPPWHVGWWLSGGCQQHELAFQNKQFRHPFSGFLHDLVVSCLLLSIAPGIAHTEPCKISFTHNHANSHCAEASSKHAKTCQYTTWHYATWT